VRDSERVDDERGGEAETFDAKRAKVKGETGIESGRSKAKGDRGPYEET
jgi:hypothetical protein